MGINSENYIILVDDDEDILNLLSDFLILSGFKTISFNSANKAINYLEKNNSSFCSLVITDYSMKEMNGVDLISIINEKFNTNGKIKFILISAFLKDYLSKMDNGKLKSAEIHKILEKPIKLEKLKSITSAILCRR